MGWAEKEFETIDLGDARLERRAVLLAERLGQKPGRAFRGRAGTGPRPRPRTASWAMTKSAGMTC